MGAVALVTIVCSVTLIAAFALKAQCLGGFDGRQYSRLCYNDIQPLYGAREVERHFPYVQGELRESNAGAELVDGAIEYPVLTGVFMWIAGRLSEGVDNYLIVTSVLLAPFAVFTAQTLARMHGRRALLWAAAPALVLYAFHNWDLLVVAAAVGAIWAWRRGRYEIAAAYMGVGGALKIYPLFLLAPLALDLWMQRDRGRAVRCAAIGVGTWLALNLPFMLVNFDGWWATYAFHSQRGANFDNMWNLAFPGAAPVSLNSWTAVLIAGSFLIALAAGIRRARNERFPGIQVAGAMVAAFLLWNKVHSPQYTLWLLPFLVLLRVHIGWWIAYGLADLAVYVGVFRWFYDFVYEGLDFTWAKKLMIGGIWARALLLVLLFFVFLRSKLADPATRADLDPGAVARATPPAELPVTPST